MKSPWPLVKWFLYPGEVIQSLDGGIISAIYVKEGDKVKKGQVVVRLDDTLTQAAYNESLAKYWAY